MSKGEAHDPTKDEICRRLWGEEGIPSLIFHPQHKMASLNVLYTLSKKRTQTQEAKTTEGRTGLVVTETRKTESQVSGIKAQSKVSVTLQEETCAHVYTLRGNSSRLLFSEVHLTTPGCIKQRNVTR